jgi:hypothetical protein
MFTVLFMDAVVAALLAWVVAQMGLAAPPPPKVSLVTPRVLWHQILGYEISHTEMKLLGIYRRDEGVIYLLESFDKESVVDRSYLVHELVHHVQRFNKVEAPCRAALERDAYRLADPYSAVKIDPFTIVLLSTCFPIDE